MLCSAPKMFSFKHIFYEASPISPISDPFLFPSYLCHSDRDIHFQIWMSTTGPKNHNIHTNTTEPRSKLLNSAKAFNVDAVTDN